MTGFRGQRGNRLGQAIYATLTARSVPADPAGAACGFAWKYANELHQEAGVKALQLAVAVAGIGFAAFLAFTTDDMWALFYASLVIIGTIQLVFELRRWRQTPAQRKTRESTQYDWRPPQG